MFILMRCRQCDGTGLIREQNGWRCPDCDGEGALFRNYLTVISGVPVG